MSHVVTKNRPDLSRRFAEVLVDAGLVTRRVVEGALRESRRARQPLGRWLIRNGHIPAQQRVTLRRLEMLLAYFPRSLRLAELLLDSGEITRGECRQALEMRARSGRSLLEIVTREGWLNRPRQVEPPQAVMQPFAAAAMLAAITMGAWAMGQSATQPHLPTVTPQAVADFSGTDLRFASLGDISPHLKRLRQRPGPYRAPPLLTGNFKQRAKKLRPLVTKHAKRYSLPPALIMAMIEKESSFNPQAQSPKLGVGLMQLVPHAGGREAYRFSERKSRTPTLQELQDPNFNIKLGTAYLRLLLDRHFDDIENEDVRVVLALAAYNWGPTRLRRILENNGVPQSIDQVEALLKQHAPTETQNYVREITYRMEAFG